MKNNDSLGSPKGTLWEKPKRYSLWQSKFYSFCKLKENIDFWFLTGYSFGTPTRYHPLWASQRVLPLASEMVPPLASNLKMKFSQRETHEK